MSLLPRPASLLLAVLAVVAPAPAADTTARNTVEIQCGRNARMEVRILYDAKDKAIKEGRYRALFPAQNLAVDIGSGDFSLARPVSVGPGLHRLVFDENLKKTGTFSMGVAGFAYSVKVTDGRGDWVFFKVSRRAGDPEPRWEMTGERVALATKKGYFCDGKTLTLSGDRLFPE